MWLNALLFMSYFEEKKEYMKIFIVFLLILLNTSSVLAQEQIIEKDWWKTYSGELNGQEIVLSVNRGSDNKIVGSTCDLIQGHKVNLIGNEYGNSLRLNAMINDSIIGTFDGYLIRKDDDFYKGEFKPVGKDASYTFDLKYSSGSYGTTEKRYVDFPGTDTQLEQFAKDLILAFNTKDKEWLSQKMYYPLPVYLKNKTKLTITSPIQFIEEYEQIATQTLLGKMTSWKTCNLSSNHSGVMLGRGEIWIWREDTATNEDPKYRINNIVTN